MDVPLATNNIGIQIGFKGYRIESSTFCPTADVVGLSALKSYIVLKSCNTFLYSTSYKTIFFQLKGKYPHKLLKIIYLILSRVFIVITILSSSLNLYSQTKEERDSVNNDDLQKEMLRSEYINVSLIVAAPGHELYSAAGHAALRMECPSKHVDYCYEFDTDVNLGEMMDYVNGNMKASLHRLYTSTYIKRYKEQNRGIRGILLNLNPEQKAYLWSILDKEADSGNKHDFDFMSNNCSSVVRMFIESTIGEDRIQYGNIDNRLTGTFRETIPYVFESSEWAQLFWNIMMGTGFDDNPGFESLLFPSALLDEWSKASVVTKDGEEKNLVIKEYSLLEDKSTKSFFSPLLLFSALLSLSVIISCFDFKIGYSSVSKVFDSILIIIETLVGLFLSYMLVFSNQMATSWNWLIVVFSPMPLIIWTSLHKSKLIWKAYMLFSIVLTFYILLTPLIPQMQYGYLYLFLIAVDLRTLTNMFITKYNSSHFLLTSKLKTS